MNIKRRTKRIAAWTGVIPFTALAVYAAISNLAQSHTSARDVLILVASIAIAFGFIAGAIWLVSNGKEKD